MSAWTVIQHIEVPSAQANMEFTSIPQTYTDLCLVVSGRSSANEAGNGAIMIIRPNGSSSNGSIRYLQGDGSAASSSTDTYIWARLNSSSYTASTFANTSVYIANYTASTAKSISIDSVNENNATANRMVITAGLWNDTTAISSITILPEGGNFVQYSSATLYGITKGSSGGVTVS
jgi:hypothetical protein